MLTSGAYRPSVTGVKTLDADSSMPLLATCVVFLSPKQAPRHFEQRRMRSDEPMLVYLVGYRKKYCENKWRMHISTRKRNDPRMKEGHPKRATSKRRMISGAPIYVARYSSIGVDTQGMPVSRGPHQRRPPLRYAFIVHAALSQTLASVVPMKLASAWYLLALSFLQDETAESFFPATPA